MTAANPLAEIYNPAFDAAVFASVPPAVEALYKQYAFADPQTQAALLSAAVATGAPIDPQLMRGWQPWTTMEARDGYGYSWVPALGQQAIFGTPFSPITGETFSGPVPAGAIKVSTKIADFPAYVPPPAPVTTSSSASPIGPLEVGFGQPNGAGDWYGVPAGDTTPEYSVYPSTPGATPSWIKRPMGSAGPVGQAPVFWVKLS